MSVDTSAACDGHPGRDEMVGLFLMFHAFERCADDLASSIMRLVCLGQASPGLFSAIGKTL